ncbi:hypothetical protein DSM21852_30130 [Methylocystis bryophila]|nr:hypothetical protein DSM21852_30130 [Methylocystis bryophila]
MDHIGAFCPEQTIKPKQQRGFTHRVQAAPLHGRFAPIEAERAKLLDIRTGRRKQQHLMSRLAKLRRKRAAKIEEIPIRIREEKQFHLDP